MNGIWGDAALSDEHKKFLEEGRTRNLLKAAKHFTAASVFAVGAGLSANEWSKNNTEIERFIKKNTSEYSIGEVKVPSDKINKNLLYGSLTFGSGSLAAIFVTAGGLRIRRAGDYKNGNILYREPIPDDPDISSRSNDHS